MFFSRKAIAKIIAILQLFYFLLLGLGILAIILGITEFLSGEVVKFREVALVIAVMIFASVYYLGLSRKIFWIVPLETISSVFGSIASIFFLIISFLYSTKPLVIFIPAAAINIFLFYFFTRKTVWEYFNFKWNKKSVIWAALIFFGTILLLQSGFILDVLTKN